MSFLNNFNKNRKRKLKLFKNLYKIKKLKIGKRGQSGRNNHGKITLYNRGGGLKTNYIIIDLLRNYKFFWNVSAILLSIEYDANRTNYISLILYSNGFLSFIPHVHTLKIGQSLKVGIYSDYIGSRYPLENAIMNQKYSQVSFFARAAGTFIKFLGVISDQEIKLMMPSGQYKLISKRYLGTYGINSNIYHYLNFFFKAGQRRLLNKRPNVRGVAMNPVDHPHGGGEGKSSGGRISVSPWGIYTKGYKRLKKKKIYRFKNYFFLNEKKSFNFIKSYSIFLKNNLLFKPILKNKIYKIIKLKKNSKYNLYKKKAKIKKLFKSLNISDKNKLVFKDIKTIEPLFFLEKEKKIDFCINQNFNTKFGQIQKKINLLFLELSLKENKKYTINLINILFIYLLFISFKNKQQEGSYWIKYLKKNYIYMFFFFNFLKKKEELFVYNIKRNIKKYKKIILRFNYKQNIFKKFTEVLKEKKNKKKNIYIRNIINFSNFYFLNSKDFSFLKWKSLLFNSIKFPYFLIRKRNNIKRLNYNLIFLYYFFYCINKLNKNNYLHYYYYNFVLISSINSKYINYFKYIFLKKEKKNLQIYYNSFNMYNKFFSLNNKKQLKKKIFLYNKVFIINKKKIFFLKKTFIKLWKSLVYLKKKNFKLKYAKLSYYFYLCNNLFIFRNNLFKNNLNKKILQQYLKIANFLIYLSYLTTNLNKNIIYNILNKNLNIFCIKKQSFFLLEKKNIITYFSSWKKKRKKKKF